MTRLLPRCATVKYQQKLFLLCNEKTFTDIDTLNKLLEIEQFPENWKEPMVELRKCQFEKYIEDNNFFQNIVWL